MYDVDQSIHGVDKTFSAIGIGNIKITVQGPEGHYHNIILSRILNCPILFINLLSVSYLQKKD